MKNEGADQSVQMYRLICDFVIHKRHRQVFSRTGPYLSCQMFLTIFYIGQTVKKKKKSETIKTKYISISKSDTEINGF